MRGTTKRLFQSIWTLSVGLLLLGFVRFADASNACDFWCRVTEETQGSVLVLPNPGEVDEEKRVSLISAKIRNALLSTVEARITGIRPSILFPGSEASVILSSSNAKFNATSLSQVTFSGGITVTPGHGDNQVLSATELSVHIVVPAIFPAGEMADAMVITQVGETQVTATGEGILFIQDALARPAVASLSPPKIHRDLATVITVYGTNTHFSTASSVAFGRMNEEVFEREARIRVTRVEAWSETVLKLEVVADANTPFGLYHVLATTGAEQAMDGVASLTVLAEPAAVPRITVLNPSVVQRGNRAVLDVTVQYLDLQAGTPEASISGLRVDEVQVSDATHARITVSAASDAPLGPSDVRIRVEDRVAVLANGLTVQGEMVVSLEPGTITMYPGSEARFTLRGTGFVAGAAEVWVDGAALHSTQVQVVASDQIQVTVRADAAVAKGAYDLHLAHGVTGADFPGAVRVVDPPSTAQPVIRSPELRSLSVTQAVAGESGEMTIRARDTLFSVDTPTVAFSGAGVTVSGIQVEHDTALRFRYAIATTASPGPRALTVTSAGDTLRLSDALTITSPDTGVLRVVVVGQGVVREKSNGLACTANGGPCEITAKIGANLQLVAEAEKGWEAGEWEGDCATDGKITLANTQECAMRFVQSVTQPQVPPSTTQPPASQNPTGTVQGELRITVLGQGTVSAATLQCTASGGDCRHAFTETTPPETLFLQAQAETGWELAAWEGDCQPDGQVRLRENPSCTARFEPFVAPPILVEPPITVPDDPALPAGASPETPACPEGYQALASDWAVAESTLCIRLFAWNGTQEQRVFTANELLAVFADIIPLYPQQVDATSLFIAVDYHTPEGQWDYVRGWENHQWLSKDRLGTSPAGRISWQKLEKSFYRFSLFQGKLDMPGDFEILLGHRTNDTESRRFVEEALSITIENAQ